MRIGIGYDVHRLTYGRNLCIGGVNIAFEKGLLGHSDADVLTHAIMDALLGAAGEPDIGQLFPDTDPRYEGISSLSLLKEVALRLKDKGYRVINIDSIVIAQAPKLAPHMDAMRRCLSQALEIAPECINIKATTEEGLGFTGLGEGMAAQAVALIES